MSAKILARACLVAGGDGAGAVPVDMTDPGEMDALRTRLHAAEAAWVSANGFAGKRGEILCLPGTDGGLARVLLGTGNDGTGRGVALLAGKLPRTLPDGLYRPGEGTGDAFHFALGWALGAYRFERYRKTGAGRSGKEARLTLPEDVDEDRLALAVAGVYLARDLINTPASDMGPAELEAAARDLARTHGARLSAIRGEALIEKNLPMIHAVGRASARAPRLLDLKWGKPSHPRVTLVGKGVCFDTGGLNLKPARGMALMKKDMGGAANVLALAAMVMAAGLPVRLRVLIPAVENSVGGEAFRPGDVLTSRKGMTVEIGNTDAEGRLVLADALALADEEAPELLIGMATLTGAARVALGPELPPFYTDDEALAGDLARHAEAVHDPLWRMPLWRAYDGWLDSKIADVNHISENAFAGSITAALFLDRFVEKARSYVHFDIFAWVPRETPSAPVGGEAQGVRALFALIAERYGTPGR